MVAAVAGRTVLARVACAAATYALVAQSRTGLHHLTLCGERDIQAALLATCQHHGWQVQVASLGETWHLLAWLEGG